MMRDDESKKCLFYNRVRVLESTTEFEFMSPAYDYTTDSRVQQDAYEPGETRSQREKKCAGEGAEDGAQLPRQDPADRSNTIGDCDCHVMAVGRKIAIANPISALSEFFGTDFHSRGLHSIHSFLKESKRLEP
jgi:hypothetical protein